MEWGVLIQIDRGGIDILEVLDNIPVGCEFLLEPLYLLFIFMAFLFHDCRILGYYVFMSY